MRHILLTHNKRAIIDDSDYEELSRFKWYGQLLRGKWKAARTIKGRSKQGSVYMHRQILGLEPGDQQIVTFIDGNGLNNQRLNLKLTTKRLNSFKNPPLKASKSKYKGVYFDKRSGKYIAMISIDGKRRQLGRFNNEVDAAYCYDIDAILEYGSGVYLNFPERVLRNDYRPYE